MKHSLILLLLLTFWMKGQSQNWVEIVQVDSKEVTKTIRTNRPDTLIKGTKLKMPVAASNFDQPIFKSPADSIQFEKTQQVIREMTNGKEFESKFADSIFALSAELRNRIIGYRKVYQGNPDFFPFDSLAFTKDRSGVKQLSLSKVKSKKIPYEVLTCQNLEELELVNTSIGRIQKKLSRLPRLKMVFIYNNKSKQ